MNGNTTQQFKAVNVHSMCMYNVHSNTAKPKGQLFIIWNELIEKAVEAGTIIF